MLVDQRGDGFDFNHDFAVTNEIRRESLNKRAPAILQGLRRFRVKRNPLQVEFNFQALVIYWFEKASSFVLVHGKTRADNGIAFVLPNQLRLFSRSCHSCFSWAKTSNY